MADTVATPIGYTCWRNGLGSALYDMLSLDSWHFYNNIYDLELDDSRLGDIAVTLRFRGTILEYLREYVDLDAKKAFEIS